MTSEDFTGDAVFDAETVVFRGAAWVPVELWQYVVPEDNARVVAGWIVALYGLYSQKRDHVDYALWHPWEIFHKAVRWCQRGNVAYPPPWRRAGIVAMIFEHGSVLEFLAAQD